MSFINVLWDELWNKAILKADVQDQDLVHGTILMCLKDLHEKQNHLESLLYQITKKLGIQED